MLLVRHEGRECFFEKSSFGSDFFCIFAFLKIE